MKTCILGKRLLGYLLFVLLTGCATATPETPTPRPTAPRVPPTSTSIPSTTSPFPPTDIPEPTPSEEVSGFDYKDFHQAYFILRVTDMNEAIEFYKDVFGSKVLFRVSGWTELSLPCFCVRLGFSQVEEGTIKHGSGQINLYVDDVNATRDYIISKGVETRDVETVMWAGSSWRVRIMGTITLSC
ncbi:MAG: VOC family protein [Anaerolineaceae bacterium]|nr:MAG: VOC family protein [Anaerolineaceae bacterium]